MTRLRQGDQVIVIAGADKGSTGRLLKIDRDAGELAGYLERHPEALIKGKELP